jgi:hypothetical protein
MAFDRTATLAEQARRFRDERIAAVAEGRTWKRVIDGPVCVTHLIPIASMARNRSLDIQALSQRFMDFMVPGRGGASSSLNLDGLVVHPGVWPSHGDVSRYTQVFRFGALEAVLAGIGHVESGQRYVESITASVFFREAIRKFLDQARLLGFSGPAIVGLAFLRVQAYAFPVGPVRDPDAPKCDRHHLVLPETWIEGIESVKDVDEIARPLLDVLWQSFDIEQCRLYDANGRWAPK